MEIRNTLRKLVLFAVLFCAFGALQSQVIFFDGLGRALVSNQELTGNAVEDDTVSNQNTIGGYTLFDLGINVMQSKKFSGRAVLRARNTFGQFFGSGSALSIREIQLQGILGEGIYYEVGDIDVEQTPYTVYNSEEIYHSFESSIFARRREILNYENFNFGNQWRLQGVQSNASFGMDKVFDKLSVNVFGTRTRPADIISIPDRFLAGTTVNLEKDSLLSIGLNYTGFLDNPSLEDDFNYNNNVLTFNGELYKIKGDSKFGIKGETGLSFYDFKDLQQDTSVSFSDFFFDVALSIEHKKMYKVGIGFREVGPQFSSPSAQTQRVNQASNPLLFSTLAKGTLGRSQTLFDRFGQEELYNNAISPVLFQTQPQYNNAQAYGIATPNRRGLYLNTEISPDSSSFLRAELNGALLSEIIGEGTESLRQFVLITGGVEANLSKKLSWDKDLIITTGGKIENVTRDGRALVDFSSTIIDAGLQAEVFNNFRLNVGAKLFNASGTEFIASRDRFNGLESFEILDIDVTEQILSAGLSYHFNEKSILSLDYFNVQSVNHKSDLNDYNIGQLFINYTVTF